MTHVATTVEHLAEHEGEAVTIRGWLYNRRSSGKIHFLQIRDGTGIVQCIALAKSFDPKEFELMGSLSYESAVEVDGQVRADARAPGGFEMDLDTLRVVSVAGEYPITKQAHGVDFLLSNRHLWLRSRRQVATLRIRDEVIRAVRDFLHEREFVCIDAPIFTPAACEGTTTLFEVKYFDQTAYLTQSGQLYNEAAAMALGRVYCFGPTFRAEKSKTRRHLMEFWMVEPEWVYCTFDEIMDCCEDFICFIVERVLAHRRRELEELERDPGPLEKVVKPFPRISYSQAVELLNVHGEGFEWGGDLGAPDETLLSGQYESPVLIHRYPKDVKAFYMKEDPEDARLALGVDVLAPEGYGEIIGGGLREESLEVLERKIAAHGLPREAFEWYLDLRRYGSVPHGGFGLGIERTVSWICGLEHVREAIPFPRMLYRMYP